MRKWLILGVIALILLICWQFVPPLTPLSQPKNTSLTRAAWIGIEWVMESHTEAEIMAFAQELRSHKIHDAYFYVSYLKPNGTFNPTYDYAIEFTRQLRQTAPEIRLLAWIGVPIHITDATGQRIDRLDNPQIRAQIADFAAYSVEILGFDGIHLNAEMAENGDSGYLAALETIRAALPEGAFFSVTAHGLKLAYPVTLTPYPDIAHHWSPEHLQAVAAHVNQIALMAYDSGLPFPADYHRWVAYQVRESAALLADSDIELIIGLPTSEEWTPSHQTQAETLGDGLYGLWDGIASSGSPEAITGIAIYPYWETSAEEWRLLDPID